jgi:hypothetical protein
MTEEEIERIRRNLDDKLYMDHAVKHIANGMTNGNVVLQIIKGIRKRRDGKKFCPYCKLVKDIYDFHSKYGTILPYCKECYVIKSKIDWLKKKRSSRKCT